MLWLIGFLVDIEKMEVVDGRFYWDSGYPALPYVRVFKEYKNGVDVKGIDFNVIESETIYNYDIGVSYGKVELGKDIKVEKNDSIFNLDERFPGVIGKIVSKGYSGSSYVIELHIFPFQYIPREKIMIKLKKIDIEINCTGSERNIFLKKTEIPKGIKIDLVVITNEEFRDLFKEFKERRILSGIRTEVFTTSWIYRIYEGVDDCEKIRNFIIDAYLNLGVKYVLIGGGIDIVPMRILYSTCYYSGFIPTDLYYADIDGSYDCNRNGIYGEDADSVDGLPDLMVGRIPFSNPEDISNYLNRVLDYETNWVFNGDVLFLGSSVTSQNEGFGPIVFEGISNILNGLVVKELYYPLFDNISNLWSGDIELNRENAKMEMNKGYNIIGHIDHSDINYIGTGILFGNKKLYNTDMRNILKRNGFFITIGCSPNALDFESFGKGYLKFNGIGFIGNVRTGWTYQWYQINDFFKAIFTDSVKTLGEAWKKIITGPLFFRSSMVLLGDPSIRIYRKKPILPIVKMRTELIDNDTVVINVTDSIMAPLKDIEVVITDGKDYHIQKKTDQYGRVYLNIKDIYLDTIFVSFVSNYTFPIVKKIPLNRKIFELLNVQYSGEKIVFTFLNKNESIKIEGFQLNTFSQIVKMDSIIDRNLLYEGDTFRIVYNIKPMKNIISGEIIISTEKFSSKYSFVKENTKEGIGLTGFEMIESENYFIVKNIHITNFSENGIKNISYGFLNNISKIIDYIPEFFDYVDTNVYYIDKEYPYFYLERDTILLILNYPYDSLISLSYKPDKNSVIINFKTKNLNRYNIYVNGIKKNLNPISRNTFEIKELKPYKNYNLKIVPVSNTYVENKEIPEVLIKTSPDELQNFPVFTEYPDYFSNQEIIDRGSVGIGDLNNDGYKEIVHITTGGNVYAINKDGEILSGFPVNIGVPLYTPVLVYDLNNDRKDEIIVSNGFSNPSIYIIDGNGNIINTFNQGNGVSAVSPVIFQVDGNNYIVFSGNNGYVYILDYNLNILNSFQLYNVSNISVGKYSSTDEIILSLTSSNNLYFYSINGSMLKNYSFDNFIWGIASVDINNDGIDEAITTLTNGKIYAVNIIKILNNFPVNLSQPIFTPPVVGDLDKDGYFEIYVITGYGKLYRIKKDGSSVFLANIPKLYCVKGVSPLISDVDGDEAYEIIVKSNDGYIYSIEDNGKITDGFPIYSGCNDWTSPLICDINNDEDNEILFYDQEGYVHCYSLKGNKGIWNMYGFSMARDSWIKKDTCQGSSKNYSMYSVELLKDKDIELYDILGRRINKEQNYFNLDKLPKGVYFIVKGGIKKKIVKIN